MLKNKNTLNSVIQIQGARTHNLKNIHLDLPRNELIVITGPSGSGKSSLAFDTLYAEGQRRYVESLSSYVRQFLDVMQKPDVDLIEGLSPAISIEQKTSIGNARSTVGTQTQIQDYLRLLFSKIGQPYCPEHHQPLDMKSVSQMVDILLQEAIDERILILAPVKRPKDTSFMSWIHYWQAEGFLRIRIGSKIFAFDDLDQDESISDSQDCAIVVDRLSLTLEKKGRLSQSIEMALSLSGGLVHIQKYKKKEAEWVFSSVYACPYCEYKVPVLSPKHFSFNHVEGACDVCHGSGFASYFDSEKIVPYPDLSLRSGAIVGWDARNRVLFQQLEDLALHYQFDLDMPFEKLSKEIQQILLYGSGKEEIVFNLPRRKVTKPFEGIISFYMRQERQADNEVLKNSYLAFKTQAVCDYCKGSRLSKMAQHVYIEPIGDSKKYTLHDWSSISLGELSHLLENIHFDGANQTIASPMIEAIASRLNFLNSVGLSYLSLDRRSDTISGGEAQRIRLAGQIGSGLSGIMYVLDEPSIGLHQRDNQNLINTLKHLRDLGNSVVVVEHDADMIRQADYIVDMGPGAGVQGGEVLYQGRVKGLLENQNSLTGAYLSGRQKISASYHRSCDPKEVKYLSLKGCTGHNLKSLNVDFPINRLICLTGISGSGKSTLMNETLAPLMANRLHRAKREVQPYKSIEGVEYFDQAIVVDQSMIGRTPRSNPATYTGIFTPIRELFAQTQESRARGYDVGRFSFNVKGGRCEACQGDGLMKIDLQFLSDIYVPCDTCHGQRYNRETLEIRYKGRTISEVLSMTVLEALSFFENVPIIARKLQVLVDVGLSYLQLGQSATTLSGGEAQRLKLALELSKRSSGRTLYMLDEPTTGLHFQDVHMLMNVLQALVDLGNTVILIEHHVDVIACADWVIDMGPDGGDRGGYIVAQGTPEEIKQNPHSVTGAFLP